MSSCPDELSDEAWSEMDLLNMFDFINLTLKGVYLEYARKKREMIPWNLPWPAIQDPAQGEWTEERVNAGICLLNELEDVRELVESAAVDYLTGKGHIFEPSSDEDDSDDSEEDESGDSDDEEDSDDEDLDDLLLEEIPCTCKFLPLSLYFPDDQKALGCVDKLKASCQDEEYGDLRHCMETYEEAFDSAVYLCELVGNPGKAQEVKGILNQIPARTRELAQEVAGVQQLQLEPEQQE